jgi:PEP-CTERM motif
MGKIAFVFVLFVAVARPVCGISFTTLDDPLGVHGTTVTGISGSDIVGWYEDASSVVHGFLYDGSTYTTLDDPFATHTASEGTFAFGISGHDIVGQYDDPITGAIHGFLYDGSTYTTLDDPLAGDETIAHGISGGEIVGYYIVSSTTHGFIFDGSTYTTLDDSSRPTEALGISGNTIVGSFSPPGPFQQGFVYEGSTFTTVTGPPGVGGNASGVSGTNVVGTYGDSSKGSHGFVFNGSSYTTIDDPLGLGTTSVTAISGNTIVGFYSDLAGRHGFIATIPEPSTIALLAIGAIGLVAMGRGGVRKPCIAVLALWAMFAGFAMDATLEQSARATTLQVDVQNPAPPITSSDTIELEANTVELVFPDGGHHYESSIQVTGFTIDWNISSFWDDVSTVQILLPMETTVDLGPLAPGTYQVDVTWQHSGGHLLAGAPDSGTGSLNFTVVPESTSMALLAIGAICLAVARRMRGALRQPPA